MYYAYSPIRDEYYHKTAGAKMKPLLTTLLLGV